MPDLNKNHLRMELSHSYLQGRKLYLTSPAPTVLVCNGYIRKRVASNVDMGTWQRSSLNPIPHLDLAFSNPSTFQWQSGLGHWGKGWLRNHKPDARRKRLGVRSEVLRMEWLWGGDLCLGAQGAPTPGSYEHLHLSTRQKINTSLLSFLAIFQSITWRTVHR